jgi:hypothetical protein
MEYGTFAGYEPIYVYFNFLSVFFSSEWKYN